MPDFYLPSLLDRLKDDAPRKTDEAWTEAAVRLSDYRKIVERDLENLLNASSLPQTLATGAPLCNGAPVSSDLADFPLIQESVLNYGIEGFSGESLSPEKLASLALKVQSVIETFEPRVQNVRVIPIKPDDLSGDTEKKLCLQKLQFGVVGFDIQAQLYAEPLPEFFRVKTEFDVKTAHFSVE